MIDQVSSTDGWNLILSRLVCYHCSIRGADTGNYTKHCYHLTEIILQMSPVSTPLVPLPPLHIRVKISRGLAWPGLGWVFVTEVLIKNQRQSSVKHNLIGLTRVFIKELKTLGRRDRNMEECLAGPSEWAEMGDVVSSCQIKPKLFCQSNS